MHEAYLSAVSIVAPTTLVGPVHVSYRGIEKREQLHVLGRLGRLTGLR